MMKLLSNKYICAFFDVVLPIHVVNYQYVLMNAINDYYLIYIYTSLVSSSSPAHSSTCIIVSNT